MHIFLVLVKTVAIINFLFSFYMLTLVVQVTLGGGGPMNVHTNIYGMPLVIHPIFV